MSEPADAGFTATHEWVQMDGDEATIGVSDYVQHKLSDIIHVELPEPDDHHYEAGEDFIVLESLRTAMDFHVPLCGIVVAVNDQLHGKPELINEDPYGAGWIVRMKVDNPDEFEHLLDYHEYDAGLPDDDEED